MESPITSFIQGEQTCQLLPTAGEWYHPMPIAPTTVGRYHLLTRRSLLLIRATGALRVPRPYGGRNHYFFLLNGTPPTEQCGAYQRSIGAVCTMYVEAQWLPSRHTPASDLVNPYVHLLIRS